MKGISLVQIITSSKSDYLILHLEIAWFNCLISSSFQTGETFGTFLTFKGFPRKIPLPILAPLLAQGIRATFVFELHPI